LEEFVTALGLHSFHLGGNSMGGWIAAAYAARYPHRVKSLWLLAAAGTEDMLLTEAVIARRAHGTYLLLASNEAEFAAVIKRIFVRPPPLPYCVRWVASRRSAAYFPLHAKIFDQLLDRGYDYQLEPLLPAITQPVLLMWGDQDSIVPLSVMRTFARLLPHAHSILLPNIGHVPQIEAPKRATDEYRAFRAGLA
jgi:pimeloyl-ACP methyl ester carboxylesterase